MAPPPPAPSLVSPANGATKVSIAPTLTWNASSGAASYQLQVSTSSTFSTFVVNQSGITSTSFAVSGLAYSTTYYWRVNAANAGGNSPWSATWSFTTDLLPPASAPTLASPSNGATGVSTSPTLSWNASSGATSYQLQLSTDPSFTSLEVNQGGITATSYAATGLANSTPYYWRVNASNAGGTGTWETGQGVISVHAALIGHPKQQFLMELPKILDTTTRRDRTFRGEDSFNARMKSRTPIVQAVQEDEKSSAWLSLGVGASYFGLTFGASFSYNYHNNVFTLRYLKADEFQFNVQGDYDNPALRFREIGFLYGRVHREDYLVLSLSVGMSLI
ncbi:MAG: fibronectin type III domain-containing protein, partial [Bacteroidota bacterium]